MCLLEVAVVDGQEQARALEIILVVLRLNATLDVVEKGEQFRMDLREFLPGVSSCYWRIEFRSSSGLHAVRIPYQLGKPAAVGSGHFWFVIDT